MELSLGIVPHFHNKLYLPTKNLIFVKFIKYLKFKININIIFLNIFDINIEYLTIRIILTVFIIVCDELHHEIIHVRVEKHGSGKFIIKLCQQILESRVVLKCHLIS